MRPHVTAWHAECRACQLRRGLSASRRFTRGSAGGAPWHCSSGRPLTGGDPRVRQRVILHVDLDACFAANRQRTGRARGGRSSSIAAARTSVASCRPRRTRAGVRRRQRRWVDVRAAVSTGRVPPVDGRKYGVSREVMAILRRYPRSAVSIDEIPECVTGRGALRRWRADRPADPTAIRDGQTDRVGGVGRRLIANRVRLRKPDGLVIDTPGGGGVRAAADLGCGAWAARRPKRSGTSGSSRWRPRRA